MILVGYKVIHLSTAPTTTTSIYINIIEEGLGAE